MFSFGMHVLRGYGQIMLQENALTGLMFLIGITWVSPVMGAASLLATFTATITATIMRPGAPETGKGLYGFNAALAGVALALFLKPVLLTWIFVIAAAVLTVVVHHFFVRCNITVFTLAFVAVTYVFLFLAHRFIPDLLKDAAVAPTQSNAYFFVLKGYGQVIFQSDIIASLLFFIAVFINAPVAGLYGLAGALASGIAALCLSASPEAVSEGLFSYNAVLCAIAFAGTTLKDGFWVLTSAAISLAISMVMARYDLVQLTLPFVAASIITLAIKKAADT